MEEANNKVDSIQEKANANIGKANTTDEVNQIKSKSNSRYESCSN